MARGVGCSESTRQRCFDNFKLISRDEIFSESLNKNINGETIFIKDYFLWPKIKGEEDKFGGQVWRSSLGCKAK